MTTPTGAPPAPLLPAGARLVHIGPHKTGSTAIQVAFQEARDELAEHGVAYASGGKGHRPDKAGWAFGVRGRPAGTEPPPMKFWKQLVREVEDSGGHRVCVSNEDFGRATPKQAARLVAQLGGDAVHVVAVARRLDRYLPSQWQERVKAGDTRDWDTWLRVVLDDDDEFAWDRKNVWFSHDVGELVGRWVDVVGADRFTLIVSDEADRELLPRTFESMLGLPGGLLKPNPSRSNRGLSWAETELVRVVNELVEAQGWSRVQRRRYVKRGVLGDMQRRPAPDGPKSPPLPEWAAERLRALSDQRVEQVRGSGVQVVGDPESMRMPADVPTAVPPLAAPALDLSIAAAAVAAVVDLALADSGETPDATS